MVSKEAAIVSSDAVGAPHPDLGFRVLSDSMADDERRCDTCKLGRCASRCSRPPPMAPYPVIEDSHSRGTVYQALAGVCMGRAGPAIQQNPHLCFIRWHHSICLALWA